MSPRARIIPALAAAVAVAALGAAFVVPALLGGRASYTDGATINEPAASVPRQILWQPPVPVGGPVNTKADEYEPRLSPDGQAFFFVRGRAGANADIFVRVRSGNEWSDPKPLTAINTASDELGPEISADGSLLLFYSDRAGGLGGYDLWASRRTGEAWDVWGEPFNLGPTVNSAFNEYSPALTPDGGELIFASNRPRAGEPASAADPAWPATVREKRPRHDYDLYRSPRTSDGFGAAEPLAVLNTEADEGTPAVSPAGDFLYFSSDRRGGFGGFDLYRARRMGGGFGAAENLGAAVNTGANELDPALSMGGFALDFSSNRAIEEDRREAGAPPDYNLFHTESREVYLSRAPSAWSWSGLWSSIWPWLLWVLLAGLLVSAAWLLRETVRSRRLSILARCLLGSAIVHLILLFLLSLWGVTNSIGELLKRPGGGAGGNRVRLTVAAPAAGGDALVQQVRGDLVTSAAEPVAPHAFTVALPSLRLSVAETKVEGTQAKDSSLVMQTEPRVAALPRQQITSEASQPAEITVTLSVPEPVSPTASAERAAAPVPADAQSNAHQSAPVFKGSSGAEPRVASSPSVSEHASLAPAIVAATPPRTAAPSAVSPVVEGAPTIDLNVPAAAAPGSSSQEATATPTTTPPSVEKLPVTSLRIADDGVSTPLASKVEQGIGNATAVTLRPLGAVAPSAASQLKPQLARVPEQAADVALRAPGPAQERAAPGAEHQPAASIQTSTSGGGATGPALHGAPFQSNAEAGPVVGQSNIPAAPVAATGARIEARVSPQSTGGASPDVGAISLSLGVPTEGASAPQRQTGTAEVQPVVSTPSADVPVARGGGSPALRIAASDAPIAIPGSSRADVPLLGNRGLAIKGPSAVVPASAADPAAAAIPDVPGALATDIRIPTETAPPTNPYAQRAPEARAQILEKHGGDPQTERAVARSLAWLAAHQSPDGRWSSKEFDDGCGECDGPSTVSVDAAVTGLAVLCFLGADHTHAKDGPYRANVSKALDWLLAQQESSGDFRHGETMYTHAIVTIALAESSGMTKDPRLNEPLTRAVGFIERARSAQGGWRYEPGQAGDTSVLGWQVMAMVSARRAGVAVSPDVLEAAGAFLDSVSRSAPGVYAYQSGQPPTASMTAEGLFCRQLLGEPRDGSRTTASLGFLSQSPPKWGRRSSTYYWYYGTLALFQHGGQEWDAWNASVKRELLAHQRTGGKAAGSWDPTDRWSLVGGRIYQTAICTLSLEVYYRYLPMYEQAPGNRAGIAPRAGDAPLAGD